MIESFAPGEPKGQPRPRAFAKVNARKLMALWTRDKRTKRKQEDQ